MRILGIDPGLRTTGFGVVDEAGGQLAYVASGTILSDLLDRVDAVCFAAPVFFHPARWYFDL